MDFTFTEEQLALRESVQQFLQAEVKPEWIRRRWQDGPLEDAALWSKMADLGLLSILVPETYGGLGLSELDFILLAEECGRVALPGELVTTALVATPLLSTVAEKNRHCAELLSAVATGEQRIAVHHAMTPMVNDADLADWVLVIKEDEIYLLEKADVSMTPYKSVDPSRRLFQLDWQVKKSQLLCDGRRGLGLSRASLNRGALGTAAQLLGLARSLLDQAVAYSGERQQFNKPIGSFQAVKHLLADCALKIDFASTPLYRAAYTTSKVPTRAGITVSHARITTGEAALLSAKKAIQVHGAMGYTWECDLHIAMKSAWALDKSWGEPGFHKKRVHDWLLRDKTLTGAGNTFGRMELGDVAENLSIL